MTHYRENGFRALDSIGNHFFAVSEDLSQKLQKLSILNVKHPSQWINFFRIDSCFCDTSLLISSHALSFPFRFL